MPDPSSTAAQWITGADRPVDAYNVINVAQDLRDKYNRFVTAVVTKVSSIEQSQYNLHADSSTVAKTTQCSCDVNTITQKLNFLRTQNETLAAQQEADRRQLWQLLDAIHKATEREEKRAHELAECQRELKASQEEIRDLKSRVMQGRK